MLPIGPLMWEHRLIERMIKLMKARLVVMAETEKLDSNFISVTTDFLRTYADRCHHGKEELEFSRRLVFFQLQNNTSSHYKATKPKS